MDANQPYTLQGTATMVAPDGKRYELKGVFTLQVITTTTRPAHSSAHSKAFS